MKNGRFPSVRLSQDCHSRAGGNPGLLPGRISLDTRFRGYDEIEGCLSVLQVVSELFSKKTRRTRGFSQGVLRSFLHVSHAHQPRGDRFAGRRLNRCGVESDLPSISDFISTQVLVGFEINDDPVLILLEGEVDDALGKKSFIIAPHNRRFATAAVLLRRSARMM
jgi:hypothetical protein